MPKQQLPNKKLAWPIAWPAVVLIALAEGLRLNAYLCPAKVWTLGWGETDGIVQGMRWTKAQADERFCQALTEYADRVLAMCKRTPNANQLGALVSLSYNIGLGGPKAKGGLYKSSVLRLFNAGQDEAASRAFGLNNKARINGVLQPLPGLTSRRAAEAALYLTPLEDVDAPPLPMPQAVAPETSLAASPLAQSGTVSAGAGALTLLSTVSDQATTVGEKATLVGSAAAAAKGAVANVCETLGLAPVELLGIALLVAAGVAVYGYLKQRATGNA